MSSATRTFALLAVALLPLTGCILRTHKVETTSLVNAPLMEATLPELVARVNAEAAKISTLNATVDIATSVGGARKGTITEYQEIRGYVLLRKPDTLRMIGLFPVVRNRAFDMVSDGERFRLSLPTRNTFIIGSKDVVKPSKNALENLRPQHILDALLLQPVDPETELAVLENGTDVVRDPGTRRLIEYPTYIVTVIRRVNGSMGEVSRKIVFSRTDLRPRRQIIYDHRGSVATIASYNNFSEYDGTSFPNLIQIERPQEEYSISLGMVKLRLNDPLRDDQFELAQPEGSKLRLLDQEPAAAEHKTEGAPNQALRR